MSESPSHRFTDVFEFGFEFVMETFSYEHFVFGLVLMQNFFEVPFWRIWTPSGKNLGFGASILALEPAGIWNLLCIVVD